MPDEPGQGHDVGLPTPTTPERVLGTPGTSTTGSPLTNKHERLSTIPEEADDDDLLLDAYLLELGVDPNETLEDDEAYVDIPTHPVHLAPDNCLLFSTSTPSTREPSDDEPPVLMTDSDDERDDEFDDDSDDDSEDDCYVLGPEHILHINDEDIILDEYDENGPYVEIYVDENLAPAVLEEHQRVEPGERSTIQVYISKTLNAA